MVNLFRLSLTMLIAAIPCLATLPLNRMPPIVELADSCGGRLDGSPWSSAEISGRVFSVYYVDPDESDLNEPLFSALKAENFPGDKVQSVAVINMRATWLPQGVLSMVLKSKQKKYRRTIYVKDNCRRLVSLWGLADHSSDIMLFNARGEVMFSIDGKLTDVQIREAIDLIWNAIGGKPGDAHR
jgi:hypothetical protein